MRTGGDRVWPRSWLHSSCSVSPNTALTGEITTSNGRLSKRPTNLITSIFPLLLYFRLQQRHLSLHSCVIVNVLSRTYLTQINSLRRGTKMLDLFYNTKYFIIYLQNNFNVILTRKISKTISVIPFAGIVMATKLVIKN